LFYSGIHRRRVKTAEIIDVSSDDRSEIDILDMGYVPQNDTVAFVMRYEEESRERIPKTWPVGVARPWCLNSYERDSYNKLIDVGHEKINVKDASEHIKFTKDEISASLQFGEDYLVYVVEGKGEIRKIHIIHNLVVQLIDNLNWKNLECTTLEFHRMSK